MSDFNTNLSNVAYTYLQYLKIPATEKNIKKYLEEHPDYPSLYSLSSLFDSLNIPNSAFTIEKEHIENLEAPFITYLKEQSNSKDFILVTQIKDDKIIYVSSRNKKRKKSKEEIAALWEKIVFVAEKTKESGERNYSENFKKERQEKLKRTLLQSAAIVIFVLINILLFWKMPYHEVLSASVILLLKLAGIGVSLLLLLYEIDKSHHIIKDICTQSKQTNCDAVLNSKASTIAGIKWSEAGFCYFSAGCLWILLPGIPFSLKLFFLSVTNALAVPYIFFSLYYQWKIVKQWCPLCLVVQGILLLELVWCMINFWTLPYIPNFKFFELIQFIVILFVPAIVWFAIKPLLLKEKDATLNKNLYKRLLYTTPVFNSLLQQQPILPDHHNIGLLIGNPNAQKTIVKVCSPYCRHCAKAVSVLDDIITSSNGSINSKIIFSTRNNEMDEKAKFVKHLLSIDSKNDPAIISKALKDWYDDSKRDYETFSLKYPIKVDPEIHQVHIDAMNNWCNEAKITKTPTIFIERRQLPEAYAVEDLRIIAKGFS